MENIKVLKFIPYFPPHVWGLESHIAEWSQHRVEKEYGDVLIVTSRLDEQTPQEYTYNGVKVLLYPSWNLIAWYPVPKFWTSEFWQIRQKCKEFKADIINTHTRFFISTIWGGVFAKFHSIPWVHIEHWVDYVKLWAKWKTACACIYDQTIGRWVFRQSDGIIGISEWCKRFIQRFTKRTVDVMHRGMDIDHGLLSTQKSRRQNYMNAHTKNMRIGFIGRIVPLKWVKLLIDAMIRIHKENPECELLIVGDGESFWPLKEYVDILQATSYIHMVGAKKKHEIWEDILPTLHIMVNPSFQEGLPTSVLEWLMSWCVVVATDVWGTREISKKKDLILIKPKDREAVYEWLKQAIDNYDSIKWLSKDSVTKYFDWEDRIKPYHSYYMKFL